MRPNKPGCWWWEDDCGCKHVAEFDSDMETLGYSSDGWHWQSLEDFEADILFGRWLGPAHPPRKVLRYSIGNSIAQLEPYAKGEYVEYSDVKEYLLNEVE